MLTPSLAQVLAGQESSLQPPVAQIGDGPEKPRPVTCQGGNCSGPWRECPVASGSLLRGLYFEELICLAEGRQRMAWADVRAGDLQPACFALDKHFLKLPSEQQMGSVIQTWPCRSSKVPSPVIIFDLFNNLQWIKKKQPSMEGSCL